MNRSRKEAVVITAFGAAALMGVWMFTTPQSPALYDGACIPTDYRYVVNNSPGVPSTQPVSETVPVTNGQVPTIQLVADNDNDPQAQLLINTGSITVPPGTTAITLAIRALAPPAVKPARGFVDGNMYEFTITTPTGAPVTLAQSPTITLRTGSGSSNAVIEHFDGKQWTVIKSSTVGCTSAPIAAITSPGDYAAVSPTPPAPPAKPSSSPAALIIAIAATFLLLLLGAITRSRRRTQPT